MSLPTEVALPVEVVDLILRFSLQENNVSTEANSQQRRLSPHTEAASSSSFASSQKAMPPIDVKHAAIVSRLSRHYRDLFQPHLYRHVTLSSIRNLRSFARTLASRADLGTNVQSLVILTTANDPAAAEAFSHGDDAAIAQSAAGDILSACPNATHLLVDCRLIDRLSTGLYQLHRPREVTLVNVEHEHHLSGIVMRHRDLTAAALQNDPRIRSILSSTTSTHAVQQSQSTDLPPSLSIPPQAERSLSHLHLIHFDGRLLHRLVTLSSLTHLVLTHPEVPERQLGAPGLSVIPRSHLMLLLGSGHIARIIIRAELATCIRIMEEIEPIQDRKLVFRPISSNSDALFSDTAQESTRIVQLGEELASLYESVSANKVDLLAEFHNRVRRDVRRNESPPSSIADADASRDSSGRSHGSSGDGTSQSASTGGNDSEDGETRQRLQQQLQQQQQPDEADSEALSDNYESDEEFDQGPTSNTAPTTRTINTNAPPLNIPIEELLRSERFIPTGLDTHTTASSPSSGTEQTSHPSPHTSPNQPRRRHPRPSMRRPTPFSLRATDLRGATLENIEICSSLYEALIADASPDLGTTTPAQPAMSFW